MKHLIRTLLIAAGLVLLSPPAFAMEDPGYDSAAYCEESSAYVRSPSLESFCLQREAEAKERVLSLTPSPERLASCREEAGQKHGSYVLLEECLNRENNP